MASSPRYEAIHNGTRSAIGALAQDIPAWLPGGAAALEHSSGRAIIPAGRCPGKPVPA